MFKKSFLQNKYNILLLTASMSYVVSMLLSVSDSIIAGNMVGEEGISAVTIVSPLYTVSLFLGALISEGAGLFFSKAAGEMNRKKMNQIFGEGLITEFLIGAVLLILGLFAGDLYFAGYKDAPELLKYAKDYYAYYVFVFALTPIYLYLSKLVFVDGDSLICNISSGVSFFCNIVVSIIACSLMGMKGIGLGSFIGISASILTLCVHFFRKTNTLQFVFYFNLRHILLILKYAVMDALTYLYDGIVTVVVNGLILSLYGERYICVYSAVSVAVSLQLVFSGIGEAMCPLVEIFLGEKNIAAQKKILKFGMRTAIVEAILYALVMFVGAPLIVSLLGFEDPEIASLCINAIRIVSLPIIGYTPVVVLSSYYLNCDRMLLAITSTALASAALPAAFSYILGNLVGLTGVWIAIGCSPLLSLIIISVYVYFRYGKDRFPFIISDEGNESESFEFELNEQQVMDFRNSVEKYLKERNIDNKKLNMIMLLCEEIPLVILERNNKNLCMECSVIVNDEDIKLVFRDDGESFELTDENLSVKSLRSYLVSRIMTVSRDKITMLTTSYNRNVISIPTK